jgi:hypothetical protein
MYWYRFSNKMRLQNRYPGVLTQEVGYRTKHCWQFPSLLFKSLDLHNDFRKSGLTWTPSPTLSLLHMHFRWTFCSAHTIRSWPRARGERVEEYKQSQSRRPWNPDSVLVSTIRDWRLATGWTYIPGRVISPYHPDWLWCPPNLLSNGYQKQVPSG